ncbi:DUF6879 family protein [Streptomyces sp. NBC_01497]|uniref:DUF6879 family protein n=1 Tax=Streptomyces sp. NBC_01497 TaxID=2903885 RepID=UPI002E31DBE4|nr:DUF6879 family protein [Streptomyces sp. NBC_01497]
MPDLIPFADVGHLFEDFEHTAWRLETRRGYGSDRGSEKYARFLATGTVPDDAGRPWAVNVRRQVGEGKRIERVRVVDAPPSEGQRYLLATGLGNVQAGEDVRNLWRSDADRLNLPREDFWLFDSRLLVRLHFDDADGTVGVTVTEDPVQVLAACQVRDAAWHHAAPTGLFQAQVPSLR